MAGSRLPNVLSVALAALAFALLLASGPSVRAQAQVELGNVDCSGTVDSIDAALVLQDVAGLAPSLPCANLADVDEDGLVTSLDASFILQYVARLIPVLPAPAIALANIPTECPTQAQLTDGSIIATDILTRTTRDLLLPRGQRITMGQELDGVLALVRAAEPAVADVHPVPQYALGKVSVYTGTELSERLVEILAGEPEKVSFVTGYANFDAMNVRLRLVGFDATVPSFPELNIGLTLCFPYHLNVPPAVRAFRALIEIEAAYAGVGPGDSPDIDALKDGDTWYVVVRDASGDCPAGCTEETLYYFTVTGEAVTQIEEAEALEDARFVELRCYTGAFGCEPPPLP